MQKLQINIGDIVKISDSVSITATRSQGQQVSFGIVAPRDMAVHRLEIYNRILAEKGLRTIEPSSFHHQN